MNNFADARSAKVSKFPSSAPADGGNATSAARSNGAGLKKAEVRTPARSSASTKRSDRTTAHEAHSTSSTCGGATAPSRQLKPKKAMNQQPPVSHFAGFDWARDHHDVVILDNGGRIVVEFRIEHTATGWKAWKEKIKAFPSLAVAIETSYGAAVEQLLDCDLQVYPVNPMNAKRYRERKCSSSIRVSMRCFHNSCPLLFFFSHLHPRLIGRQTVISSSPAQAAQTDEMFFHHPIHFYYSQFTSVACPALRETVFFFPAGVMIVTF
ncbi:MAG: transposase [Verrucomicrobiae bacterium]